MASINNIKIGEEIYSIGHADKAAVLEDFNVGDSNTPVYFKDGIPVAANTYAAYSYSTEESGPISIETQDNTTAINHEKIENLNGLTGYYMISKDSSGVVKGRNVTIDSYGHATPSSTDEPVISGATKLANGTIQAGLLDENMYNTLTASATENSKGLVKPGAGLSVNDGTLQVKAFTLDKESLKDKTDEELSLDDKLCLMVNGYTKNGDNASVSLLNHTYQEYYSSAQTSTPLQKYCTQKVTSCLFENKLYQYIGETVLWKNMPEAFNENQWMTVNINSQVDNKVIYVTDNTLLPYHDIRYEMSTTNNNYTKWMPIASLFIKEPGYYMMSYDYIIEKLIPNAETGTEGPHVRVESCITSKNGVKLYPQSIAISDSHDGTKTASSTHSFGNLIGVKKLAYDTIKVPTTATNKDGTPVVNESVMSAKLVDNNVGQTAHVCGSQLVYVSKEDLYFFYIRLTNVLNSTTNWATLAEGVSRFSAIKVSNQVEDSTSRSGFSNPRFKLEFKNENGEWLNDFSKVDFAGQSTKMLSLRISILDRYPIYTFETSDFLTFGNVLGNNSTSQSLLTAKLYEYKKDSNSWGENPESYWNVWGSDSKPTEQVAILKPNTSYKIVICRTDYSVNSRLFEEEYYLYTGDIANIPNMTITQNNTADGKQYYFKITYSNHYTKVEDIKSIECKVRRAGGIQFAATTAHTKADCTTTVSDGIVTSITNNHTLSKENRDREYMWIINGFPSNMVRFIV